MTTNLLQTEVSALLDGLQAAVTVADENYRIIYMNHRSVELFAKWGGAKLIGSDLLACHSPSSQEKIRRTYTRFRNGDLTPAYYRVQEDDGTVELIYHVPVLREGKFWACMEIVFLMKTSEAPATSEG